MFPKLTDAFPNTQNTVKIILTHSTNIYGFFLPKCAMLCQAFNLLYLQPLHNFRKFHKMRCLDENSILLF